MTPSPDSADAVADGSVEPLPQHRWSPTYAALIALGLVALCLPVPVWVYQTWMGGMLGGAAAGLLTVPICLVLAWLATRRPVWLRLSALPDRPGAAGWLAAVVLALIAVMVWAAPWGGDAWDGLMLGGPLAIGATWLWLWGALGWGRARGLVFPVAFAGFALPWEYFLRGAIDTPLQAWTADIALQGLRIAGYPMRYWNSYTIYSPDYFIIVNETCSGMNMLVTLGMYTLIYAWMAQPRMGNRAILLAMVFPLSMLANGARVAVIYLLGHYGGVPAAEGFWHTGSAYVIFVPVFWFVYVLDRALTRRDRRARAAARSKSPPQSAIHQSPQRT